MVEPPLAVAERPGGVIDMGGLLRPRLLRRSGIRSDEPAEAGRLTSGMAGKVIAVPHSGDEGGGPARHVADAAVLPGWLRRPDVRMIG